MKKIRLLSLCTLLLTLYFNNVKSQDTYWSMVDNQIYNVATGAFMPVGTNNIPVEYPTYDPRSVIDGFGKVLFSFGSKRVQFYGDISSTGGESVIPVPGQCKQFLLIHTSGINVPHGSYLNTILIDAAGVTDNMYTTQDPIVSDAVYLENYGGTSNFGSTVSPINSNGEHYIYYMRKHTWPDDMYTCGLWRYTVASDGTINTTPYVYNVNLPYIADGSRIKMAGDGKSFAYSDINGKLVIYNIELNIIFNHPAVSMVGAEMVLVGGSRRWYVSTGSSFGYTNESGGFVTLSTTYGLKTEVNLGVDGRIYFAHGDPANSWGDLYAISTSTTSIASNNMILNSSGKVYTTGTRYSFGNLLPGENTNKMYLSSTPQYTVNGSSVYPTTPLTVYNCKKIILSRWGGNQAGRYQIRITAPGDPFAPYYTSSWQYGLLPDSIDLRNLCSLPGSGTCDYLANHTGQYDVSVTYSGRCNENPITSVGRLNVVSGPQASLGIQTNYKMRAVLNPPSPVISYSYPVVSQEPNDPANPYSPSNPQVVGRNQTTFSYTVNTGVGANGNTCGYYSHLDKWNGNSWINDIIPTTEYLNQTCSALAITDFPLSGFLDADYNSWFANTANAPNNSIWRHRVDLYNECGTIKRGVVFKVVPVTATNAYLRPAGSNGNMAAQPVITIYPNPLINKATIAIVLPEKSKVSMTIFSADGRPVAVPVRGAVMAKGTNTLTLGTMGWASGIYYYEITISGVTYTGKLVKS